LFSTHVWPAEPAFLLQYATAWRSSVKSAAVTSDVSRTTAAAAATTADDVTAASDDVIASTDDVTAPVNDVVVGPATAAAADHDGSGK